MVSIERAREIAEFARKHGKPAAADAYGLQHESVSRMTRLVSSASEKQLASCAEGKKPRVLEVDIETSPVKCWTWNTIKAFIAPEFIIEPHYIMSWAAKWLGSDDIAFDSAEGEIDGDRVMDERLCGTLWELCKKADVVIGHNGKAFDVKHMRTRWMLQGLTPPATFHIIDTLKMAREFRFERNKLDYIARLSKIGKKLEHHGNGLWIDCLRGDKEAWKLMREYNLNDVILLEEIYLMMRPWFKGHPNLALYYNDGKTRCTRCGSSSLSDLGKDVGLNAQVYPGYRCDNCGGLLRSRKKLDRERTLAPIA